MTTLLAAPSPWRHGGKAFADSWEDTDDDESRVVVTPLRIFPVELRHAVGHLGKVHTLEGRRDFLDSRRVQVKERDRVEGWCLV